MKEKEPSRSVLLVSKETHRVIKTKAAEHGISMGEYIKMLSKLDIKA